jgi:H+/gluconate symporter-like permease
MIRLIFHIVLLAVVAAFVALNVSHTTTVNLFSLKYTGVSTATVVLIAFIAGIVYSFILYLMHYFRNSGRKKLKEQKQQFKDKEKELKAKESELTKKGDKGTQAAADTGALQGASGQEKDSGGGVLPLFSKRKKRGTKSN